MKNKAIVKTWKDLSLKEKIGQTVVLLVNPDKEIKTFGSIEAFLEKYQVGGIFVGGEVIKEATDGYEKIKNVISDYNKYSNIPLLVASDLENGSGSMINGLTVFPHMMALGAAASEELAYEYGKGTALESVPLGINWTFSPVSDLNQNQLNPVTNIRSISDNPTLAVPLLKAVIMGMQDHGLAATAKHFPGDGTDYRDQHLVTTKNSLDVENWWKNHGLVFHALINAGVSSIMTGHIALPAYQKELCEGRCLPATLSYELTTKLLKQEMCFNGVVVSDALIMGGFMGWYGQTRAEIECFKAGTDMMLWPTLEYFGAMEQAILSGDVSMVRLDDAVSRIWKLKERLGLFNESICRNSELGSENRIYAGGVARKVAEKSITLLRDRKKQLPLQKDCVNRIALIAITHHGPAFESMNILKKELEAYGIDVLLKRNIEFEELEKILPEYDLIIYVLYARPHQPIGPLSFCNDEARSIWVSLTLGMDKSIVVSLGSPYYFNEYFEQANIYINTYSNSPDSQKALVKALFGDIQFQERSPVNLKYGGVM